MKYCFIVINYNNSDITIDCIKSILLQSISADLIIVVDNCSAESQKEKLRAYLHSDERLSQSVKMLFLAQNIGYFPAINAGLRSLKNIKEKVVIVGNNDLDFSQSFIYDYERKAYADDILVVCPDIMNKNSLHQNPHLIDGYSNFTILYRYLYYSSYCMAVMLGYIAKILCLKASMKNKVGYDKSQYITMGFGACYILTANFFSYFNKLDDYVFLMGEEGVLANQVIKVGGKIYYDKDLLVRHEDSATFERIPTKRIYDYSRESFWTSRKYYKLKELKNENI